MFMLAMGGLQDIVLNLFSNGWTARHCANLFSHITFMSSWQFTTYMITYMTQSFVVLYTWWLSNVHMACQGCTNKLYIY